MNDLNLILCLIHLYFPAAYHADWCLAKGHLPNQMDTNYLFPSLIFSLLPKYHRRTLSSSSQEFLPSYLGTHSLNSLLPLLSARTTHWVTVFSEALATWAGLFQAFSFWSLFSEDLQHWKLLLIPLFWRFRKGQMLLVPCLSSSHRLLCWLLLLQPFHVGVFHHLPSWFIFPTSSVYLSLRWSHQFPQPSVFICSQF